MPAAREVRLSSEMLHDSEVTVAMLSRMVSIGSLESNFSLCGDRRLHTRNAKLARRISRFEKLSGSPDVSHDRFFFRASRTRGKDGRGESRTISHDETAGREIRNRAREELFVLAEYKNPRAEAIRE